MRLLFLGTLISFCGLQAQSLMQSCMQESCEDIGASSMSWARASDALHLSYRDSLCVPDIETLPRNEDDVSWSLRANQWRIRDRVGQASLLQGDLFFVSDSQTLKSNLAWLWRSADGGLDQLCLPQTSVWNHASWKIASSHIVYRADTDEMRVCHGAFVLHGENDLPLYGYAEKISSQAKQVLTLKTVHATACPMHRRTWSLSAEQLDWDAQKKQAVIKNARFYLYDMPIFRVSKKQLSLGDKDPYGWQVPKLGSYYDNLLLVTFPYRVRSNIHQIVAPWVGSDLSLGGLYSRSYHHNELYYRSMLRAGLYRDTPIFRYGAIVQGHRKHFLDADLIQFQFLHMRDGWYAQYFSPEFLPGVRPNQDLPNYVHYQKKVGDLNIHASLEYYQKFEGDKVLQDEIAVPYLHVLPRFNLAYNHRYFEASGLFEHLVSESSKDHYPGVVRSMAYWGGHLLNRPQLKVGLGSWVKDQQVDDYSSWGAYNHHHYFWAPNIEITANRLIHRFVGVDLSYAYTRFVDQASDPVFQRKWQWLSGQPSFDKLASVDRVYDRNRLWLGVSGINLPIMLQSQLSLRHIIDFEKPKVALSANGVEDPLIGYPNKVSVLSFNSPGLHFSSSGVWVWPTRTMQYYDLQWQHDRLKLQWARQPDFVVVQDQVVRVPFNKTLSGELDVFKTQLSKFYVAMDYQSGVDRSLRYQFFWKMDRCCWQGKASISLKKWMSDSTSSDLFSGWQPSASLSFSLKGLTAIS